MQAVNPVIGDRLHPGAGLDHRDLLGRQIVHAPDVEFEHRRRRLVVGGDTMRRFCEAGAGQRLLLPTGRHDGILDQILEEGNSTCCSVSRSTLSNTRCHEW